MQRATCSFLLAVSLLFAGHRQALLGAEPTQGFNTITPAAATVQEIDYQYNFWVLEVHFKSLRMIEVPTRSAESGASAKQLIWYLVYKAIRRPQAQGHDGQDLVPNNSFAPEPLPPIFAPELILVTNDNGVQKTFHDEVLPQAQAAIMRRERLELKNVVDVVGPLPPATPDDVKSNGSENAIYGVAMWRGVDPDTDYFKVIMTGFSNGYKYVQGPVAYQDLKQLAAQGQLRMSDQVWDVQSDWQGAGEVENLFDDSKTPPENVDQTQWFCSVPSDHLQVQNPPEIWRKTLIQEYWRPGDRFDQSEFEIRHRGAPVWTYRPDRRVEASLIAPSD